MVFNMYAKMQINNIRHIGRIMPSYWDYKDSQVEVSVRPSRIRLRLWPYLTGTYIPHKIRIKNKTNSPKTYKYIWRLLRFDLQTDRAIAGGNGEITCNPHELCKQELELPYITISGEYRLSARCEHEGKGFFNWSPMLTFKLRVRDEVLPAIFIAIISLAVGIALTKFIEWLIGIF